VFCGLRVHGIGNYRRILGSRRSFSGSAIGVKWRAGGIPAKARGYNGKGEAGA
jgi:hypothetical protein